jgi:hypothetical protein
MPSKLGRIADPRVAFWHISRFFTTHPGYRNVPFARMRFIQQAIAVGNYYCLGDGKIIQAVATWRPINLSELLRVYPHVPSSSESTDKIFLTSLAAVNRTGLKIMIRHLRTSLSDKDVYWDRHNGKLGHRPGKPQS